MGLANKQEILSPILFMSKVKSNQKGQDKMSLIKDSRVWVVQEEVELSLW